MSAPPARLPWRGLIGGVVLGVVVFAAIALYADLHALGSSLDRYAVSTFVVALGASLINYGIRFLRWQYYLGRLDLRVPAVESLLVFLGGMALAVTPGKVGDVVKSALLKGGQGLPISRTVPVVFAERLTDLLGVTLLAVAGAYGFARARGLLIVAAAIVVAAVLAVSWERGSLAFLAVLGRWRLLARFAGRLEDAYRGLRVLVSPGPLLFGTVLSVVAWFAECVGFYAVVAGFAGAGARVDLGTATFIYSASTLAGALAMLPGGLGVTEAGMVELLRRLASVPVAVAGAATILTRLATLWFAVAIGVAALVALRHRWALAASQ